MAEEIKVAVPSEAPGGMEAGLSGHFGHCDVFTLVTVKDGAVTNIEPLQNIPHEQGGCMAPVNLLAQNGVKALIAGGMGMRPLMGFNSVGIEVLHNNGLTTVGDAINALLDTGLPRFSNDNVCGGGGEHAGGCGNH